MEPQSARDAWMLLRFRRIADQRKRGDALLREQSQDFTADKARAAGHKNHVSILGSITRKARV